MDKGIVPVISVAKLIDLLKISGMTLTYQQLLDMTKDPTIAQSIKSINKNQVTIALRNDEVETPIENFPPEENTEEDNVGEDDEDFNPDDFNSEDEEFGNNLEEPNYENTEEPQEHNSRYGQEKSTVSNMARRALSRAD